MFKTSIAISPEKTKFGPLLFAGSMEEGIKRAAELGFDGVDLSIRDVNQLDTDSLFKLLKTALRHMS